MMNKFSCTVAAAVTVAAGDTVTELQADGYNVQINGNASVPLSECTTTGVHGVSTTNDSSGPRPGHRPFTTVEVDISCPV